MAFDARLHRARLGAVWESEGLSALLESVGSGESVDTVVPRRDASAHRYRHLAPFDKDTELFGFAAGKWNVDFPHGVRAYRSGMSYLHGGALPRHAQDLVEHTIHIFDEATHGITSGPGNGFTVQPSALLSLSVPRHAISRWGRRTLVFNPRNRCRFVADGVPSVVKRERRGIR